MNKNLMLELPKGVMCCFVNYVYATPEGVLMGTSAVDGDDLYSEHKICKGADGYVETED